MLCGAEVGDDFGVFAVGFVALELAGGISLDAQRVHDADLVPAPVQLECEVFAITGRWPPGRRVPDGLDAV